MSDTDNFGHFFTAITAKDVLEDLIVKVINTERPKPKYGTVVSVDVPGQYVQVQYPDYALPVWVQLGEIQNFQVGQKVRVNGPADDRYIDEGASGIRLLQTWNLSGPLTVSRGDDWPYLMSLTPEFWVVSLTVTGTTTTTIELLKNGSMVGSLSLGSGVKINSGALSGISIAALTDFLAQRVTAVGTGAEGAVVQVYGR